MRIVPDFYCPPDVRGNANDPGPLEGDLFFALTTVHVYWAGREGSILTNLMNYIKNIKTAPAYVELYQPISFTDVANCPPMTNCSVGCFGPTLFKITQHRLL